MLVPSGASLSLNLGHVCLKFWLEFSLLLKGMHCTVHSADCCSDSVTKRFDGLSSIIKNHWHHITVKCSSIGSRAVT